jgi:uncharacterized SAM-binding protein YcdF (DUF218 family)
MHGSVDRDRSLAASRCLGGILLRRERWSLSWKGWGLLLGLSVLTGAVVMRFIHPFLAVSDPTPSPYLVMEGWVQNYAVTAAAMEFRRGTYERVLTTGGPVPGMGQYINDYQTSASVGAERLIAFGLPTEVVQMVPSRLVDRDRTYSSALALRKWLQSHAPGVTAITVLTEDLHARRTRLLFQKALGRGMTIGIIAVANPDYDAHRWWRYSEGVRDVIGETIAYLYARVMFHPPPPPIAPS